MAVCLKSFIQYENGDFSNAQMNLNRLKRNFNIDDPYAKAFSAKIDYQSST